MSTCQLLVKKPTVSKREIKIVLERNGYQRAKLESEDFDGRIVTLDVPEDDYKYIRKCRGGVCKILSLQRQIFEKHGGLQLDDLVAEETLASVGYKLIIEIQTYFGFFDLNVMQDLGSKSPDFFVFCTHLGKSKSLLSRYEIWVSTSRASVQMLERSCFMYYKLMWFETNHIFKSWYGKEPSLIPDQNGVLAYLQEHCPKMYNRIVEIVTGRHHDRLSVPFNITGIRLIIILLVLIMIFNVF